MSEADDTLPTWPRGPAASAAEARSPRPRRHDRRSAEAPAPTAAAEPDRRAGRPALYAESRLEDLVVITGYSGAGKSTAMDVFEDAGYFCVDNLPPEMIRALVELFMHEGSKVERAAVVSDVRGGDYFEALQRRARRPRRARRAPPRPVPRRRRGDAAHPLQGDPPPPSARARRRASAQGIAAERALLEPLKRARRRRHRLDRPQGAHAAAQDRRRVPAARAARPGSR